MKIKQIIFSDVIVGERLVLTITEFRNQYHVEEEAFVQMLEYGLFSPLRVETDVVYLDLMALQKIQTAQRLQRDLGVNLAGAALALDLMEQLEELRKELSLK